MYVMDSDVKKLKTYELSFINLGMDFLRCELECLVFGVEWP